MDFATLMTREPAIPFLGPLTPQRGSFSRSSTSSTVTTISNLSTPSFISELSATSTAVGDVEEKGTEQCEDCGWSIRPTTGKGETALLLQVPGKDFALKPLVASLRARLQSQLADSSRAPRIVGLLATSDTGCKQYASATAKACMTNGVHFDVENVTETVGQERVSFDQVKTAIEVLNADMTVDGLIVYFPIFNPEQDDLLRRAISPRIDVEGVHPQSLVISSYFPPGTADDSTEDEVVHPCTALAVVRILQSLASIYQSDAVKGQRLVGKTVTIVNRSETVGRPLAAMLANEGAMVFSIDITGIQVYHRHNTSRRFCINPAQDHITPNDCFGTSDVIISAVPSDKYKVPTSSIKHGAICVNVATGNNFEDEVNEAAGMFVRRVGGVTTLMLQMNAMTLFRRHNEVA